MMGSCGGAINLLSGAAGELENHGVIGQDSLRASSHRLYSSPLYLPKLSSVLFTANHVLSPIMFMIELFFSE